MIVDDILKLVGSVVKKRNAALVDRWDAMAYKDRKLPDYYDGYKRAVVDHERIEIHANPGKFPDKLFLERSPNQTQEEFDYEKKNYKQTTLPVFVDFINTISRIFSDGNWSIVFGQEKEKYTVSDTGLQKYLEATISDYGSVEDFIKALLPPQMMRDPMGVIAVRPSEFKTIDVDGQSVTDNSAMIEPKLFYFECENVVAEDPNKYILVQSYEKSTVIYNSKPAEKGLVYEFYDENEIWFIRQIGNYVDFRFEAILFYKHDTGSLPAWRLKGVPVIHDGKAMWQSQFLYACDSLDLVALNQSRLQISTNSSVYPYKVMVGTPCDFSFTDTNGSVSQCLNGSVYDSSSRTNITCPGCRGTGLKSRMSPTGVLLLNPVTREGEGDAKMNIEPLKYVSPETGTLEFLREQCRIDETRARNILHLRTTNTQATGPEGVSATGDTLDMKAMYGFIKPISDLIFTHYQNVIDKIGQMRYGQDYVRSVVVYPVTFDFMTESDYMKQISEATASGAPSFLIQAIMYRFLKALYYNEQTTSKAFDLLYHTDRILTKPQIEIVAGLSRGIIADWEVILHDSGIFLVNQLFMANNKFFELDFPDQQAQLIQAAKDKAAEIKPVSSNQIGQGILALANQ